VNLLTASQLSLRLRQPWSDDALAESDIVAGRRETGQVITGQVLEAAIEWKGHHLLLVTDDIPFEDSLRIYLFDTGWTLLDSVAMGAMYATGVFSHLELLPPNGVRFQFIDNAIWTIELLEQAVVAFPFSDPKGVSRPFSLHRRFNIQRR
jgi:hypothetical protein